MLLTFLGAAMTVTGSSYLLETGDLKVLIDCGMFQGSKPVEAFNRRPFAYTPGEIDCVLLTHCHIDHSGLLPRLVKEGFAGAIYATKSTVELCNIMLPDSAHIQEFDAEIINRKGRRAGRPVVEPLYTVEDAQTCLKQFAPVHYDADLQLAENVRVSFRDAGHILGSSIIEVWVTEEGITNKLVFSGDLGQPGQPIIKDPTVIEQADFLIMESTYGDRVHEEFANKEAELALIINETYQRGGNVIIPAFAVGRTQILLYHLHQLFKNKKIPDLPVIIDSPLAISATDIFRENVQDYDQEAYSLTLLEHDSPLTMPNLTFSHTAEESKALNSIEQPVIILSASGMADAGRILHHLKHNLWRENASVLFVGYQAQGSLGRRLTEGAKKVKIMGEEITVKAKIHNLEGFSAHADQGQLVEWVSRMQPVPKAIFLVHGERNSAETLARIVEERFKAGTMIPEFGDQAQFFGKDYTFIRSGIAPWQASKAAAYLMQLDHLYQQYRERLDKLLREKPEKMAEVSRRLEKIQKYINKILNDLF